MLTKLKSPFITDTHVFRLEIIQELCESRGGRPGLSVLTSLLVSVDVNGTGLSLSLICQLTSEDIKQHNLPTYLPVSLVNRANARVQLRDTTGTIWKNRKERAAGTKGRQRLKMGLRNLKTQQGRGVGVRVPLSSVPLHRMTSLFLSDRNPLWTHSNVI